MPAILGTFLARYWPYVAGAALIVAAWIGFNVLQNKLDAAKAQRDQFETQLGVSNASVAGLQTQIIAQNKAVEEMNADSERRLMEGRALILSEVRKGTAAVQAATQLAAHPKTGGDQSKSSDAVMALRKDL